MHVFIKKKQFDIEIDTQIQNPLLLDTTTHVNEENRLPKTTDNREVTYILILKYFFHYRFTISIMLYLG